MRPAGDRLDRDVGDPEPDARSDAEQQAVLLAEALDAVGQYAADSNSYTGRLERDDRENPVSGVVVLPMGAGRQHPQPAGHDHKTQPLASLQAKPEEALCKQSEQHQAAGDHRLR